MAERCRKVIGIAWMALGALACIPSAAAASAASASSSETGLEEIIVTAQKRAENLQTVPIAISVLTANQLENAAVTSSIGLTTVIPSLYVGHQAAYNVTYLRGIGTNLYTPGSDPSVAMYVDGVYSGNLVTSMAGFNNIERVEVLKGPQGTLYGRNTIGGLINIVTPTPTQGFKANTYAGGGSFDTFEAGGYIAGGIAPGVAADLAVKWSSQGQGYYHNIVTGKSIAREDGEYLRSKVVVDLSDATRLTLIGSTSNFNNTVGVPREAGPGSHPLVPPGGVVPTAPGYYADNAPERGNVKDYLGSANLSFDLNAARVVSITAYDYTIFTQANDGDDSTLDLVNTPTRAQYKQFTQELQLLSPSNSKVSWIVGAFYLWADSGYNPIDVITHGVLIRSATNPASTFSTAHSASGFAQASIDVFDGGRLTAGARYTYDKKDYRRSYAPGTDPSMSWSRPTWRLAHDQKVGKDNLLYASYNRGYKSGAYNIAFGGTTPVNPETLDAFELGLKSDFLNKRLRIDTAAFYDLYDDMQVKLVAPGNVVILTQNAAKSHIYGIDGDIDAVVTDDLQLKLGFSWVHARFVSYPNAVAYIPNPSGIGGNVQTALDAAGKQLPNSPELSASLTLYYSHQVDGGGKLYGSATEYVCDSKAWDPANLVRTGGYALLGGTIGYTLPDRKYSFELWGANLTNEIYADYVTPAATPSNRYSYAPPRTYGARVRVEF